MKKLVMIPLLAISFVYAAEPNKFVGTWKLDAARSIYSDSTAHPAEATLTIADEAWTYTSTDTSGKKSAISSQGDDKFSVKSEPTGNPYLADTRFIDKQSGKETTRSVAALLPDGKTFVMYSSGVGPDGKTWSDVTYWTRIR
ncbi:MAG: hypothetical protein JO270_04640 [Acidobacteriaceae bacterium]|nr:hypothetical protein [Acidobacteriaceae bacterium]MBV8573343.1 hypothetical protein [Acidobacteriaceae bacterium]